MQENSKKHVNALFEGKKNQIAADLILDFIERVRKGEMPNLNECGHKFTRDSDEGPDFLALLSLAVFMEKVINVSQVRERKPRTLSSQEIDRIRTSALSGWIKRRH